MSNVLPLIKPEGENITDWSSVSSGYADVGYFMRSGLPSKFSFFRDINYPYSMMYNGMFMFEI